MRDIIKGGTRVAKRESVYSNDIDILLPDNSKEAIEHFLSHYALSSQANMTSAVNRLLYLEIGKEDISKLNYEDYLSIFPDENKVLNAQEKYKQTFFKFLYSYDYLDLSEGFEQKWIKESEKQQFIKRKERLDSNETKKTKPKETLNIEEITSIQRIINLDSTKLTTLKMQFCWFALFELGIEVETLKKIGSYSFNDSFLVVENKTYEIPLEFHEMFREMQKRDSNGFKTVNLFMESLGKHANLSRKLTPVIVKKTRKEYMVTCANCGSDYLNSTQNWLSVNNRIVCITCAGFLKKKKYEVTSLPILPQTLDEADDYTGEPAILFTYNDLKQRLLQFTNESIDFLKLHKFQIMIGQLGEAYVYQYELEKLEGTMYVSKIDGSVAINPSNGFDILSFEKDGTPLHIEVKATVGSENNFYLSNHELNTARAMKEAGLNYIIYFVKEILSATPQLVIIKDISTNKDYLIKEMNWIVTKR